MAADPANYQQIQPVQFNLTMQRLQKAVFKIGPLLHFDDTPVDLDPDTEFQVWFAPPFPPNALGVNVQKYDPVEPILWSPMSGSPYFNHIYLQLCGIDLSNMNIWTGSIPYQILCTKDAGETVETVCKGTITVPSYLTYTWV